MAKLEWDGNVLHMMEYHYVFQDKVPESFKGLIERILASHDLAGSFLEINSLKCNDDLVTFSFHGADVVPGSWGHELEMKGTVTYNRDGLTILHTDGNFANTHSAPLQGPWDHLLFS